MMPMSRSYSELIALPTFEERFKYLQLKGKVADLTFGGHRYANQKFYTSPEWRRFRRDIILRDCGCDLAFEGREIPGLILVHHINPITIDDIVKRSPCLMDPENVVIVQKSTHDAIHYGDESLLFLDPVIRLPNDTSPWR